METLSGPAAPAGPALDPAGVCEQEEEGEPVGDSGCDGRAEEAEVEGVDEEEVEAGVDGGGDEEDVGSWSHDFCTSVSPGRRL